MDGDYLGYDGPFPPPNDLRLHRYFFRLFALDIAALSVPARFTAAEVKQAMKGHVLAEAVIWGSDSMPPALRTSSKSNCPNRGGSAEVHNCINAPPAPPTTNPHPPPP